MILGSLGVETVGPRSMYVNADCMKKRKRKKRNNNPNLEFRLASEEKVLNTQIVTRC